MRQQTRVLGAVALAAVTLGGVSACGDLLPGETFEDDAAVKEKVTSVRLENGPGSVTVRGKEKLDKVSLQRSVEYHDDKPEGQTHKVEDGVLVLGGCGDDCEVKYTVEVPAGIPVTGETSSGALDLSQVGSVKVSTSSGRVTLNGVAGTVDVRTSNGRIQGKGLEGKSIKTQTSNGEIDLTPKTAQDVRAKTSNGSIDLKVPSGTYRVSAETNNGSKNIGVSHNPSGDHRLDLTTSNGEITVKGS